MGRDGTRQLVLHASGRILILTGVIGESIEAVDEAVRRRMNEILGGMECPKGFKCAESGFENLCKARDIGVLGYLDCLEAAPDRCTFALPFGYGYLCKCPLRVHVAKTLGR